MQQGVGIDSTKKSKKQESFCGRLAMYVVCKSLIPLFLHRLKSECKQL